MNADFSSPLPFSARYNSPGLLSASEWTSSPASVRSTAHPLRLMSANLCRTSPSPPPALLHDPLLFPAQAPAAISLFFSPQRSSSTPPPLPSLSCPTARTNPEAPLFARLIPSSPALSRSSIRRPPRPSLPYLLCPLTRINPGEIPLSHPAFSCFDRATARLQPGRDVHHPHSLHLKCNRRL